MRILTDVSFYAEYPNFEQMALHADGTILRAGQGSWIDPVFVENLVASKDHLPRGAYWFYDGRTKPARQVDLLLEALGDSDLELPIFGDYERSYGGEYDGWKSYHDFLRILGDALPETQLGVYTGYYYWREMVPASAHYLFRDFYLWEANYNPLEYVKIPAPWSKMDLWQYTESGDAQLYGLDPYVKKAIDLNKFMGTEDDWINFGGVLSETEEVPDIIPDITPDIIPDKAPDTITGKLLAGMNLRTSPVVSDDNHIGFLFQHTDVSGKIIKKGADSWLEMDAGSFGKLYVAEYYGGNRYIESTPEPVPSGGESWNPDPNRPDELYFARDTGYRKVAVDLDEGSSWTAPQSTIFIGDNEMTIEEALNNIAEAINNLAGNGGYNPPSGGNRPVEPPVEPPVDDRIMHTIKPKSNGSFPIYRTPTTNEINKIRLVLVADRQVEEREPPKKIHNTPVWNTAADLHNLMRDWAWLPRQEVIQAANNKMVTIPNFYIDDTPVWQGSFIERKYLA